MISHSINSWKWTVIVLSLAYLLAELVFNVRLVDVMSSTSPDSSLIHDVEILGRTVSAIGVSLLISDIVIGIHKPKYKTALIILGLNLITVGPGVYYGQKELVEYLLVERSTAEQKKAAFYAQIIQYALANNLIKIKNLPYDVNDTDKPENKTFLAIFGGVAYFDPNVIKVVSASAKTLIDNHYKQVGIDILKKEYPKYKSKKNEIRNSYEKYKKSSLEYYKNRNSVDKELNKTIREINTKLRDGHMDLYSETETFHSNLKAKSSKLSKKLYDFLSRRNKCKTAKCFTRYDKLYYKELDKQGIRHVKPEFWYKREQSSEAVNAATKIATAVFTLGFSVLAEAVNSIADDSYEFNPDRTFITSDENHYFSKLAELTASDFKTRSGYEYVLDEDNINFVLMDEKTFKNHPETVKRIRKAVQDKGLGVPNNWYYQDHAALGDVISAKINKKVNSKWEVEMAKKGLRGLKPGLSWDKFQRAPIIQKKANSKISMPSGKPFLFDWNNEEFFINVIKPDIDKEKRKTLELVFAHASTFETGGINYETGKDAVRNTTIPLVSLVLSLTLCVLTITKIIPKIMSIVLSRRDGSLWWPYRAVVAGTYVFSLVVIFSLPMHVERHDMNNSVVKKIIDSLQDSSGKGISEVSRYLLYTQPLVYEAGSNGLQLTKKIF